MLIIGNRLKIQPLAVFLCHVGIKILDLRKYTTKLAAYKVLQGVYRPFVGTNYCPGGKIGMINAQKLYYLFRILRHVASRWILMFLLTNLLLTNIFMAFFTFLFYIN